MITDDGALSSRVRKPKYEMPTHLWADMIFRQPPELLGVGRAGRTASCCCTEHKSWWAGVLFSAWLHCAETWTYFSLGAW